MAPPRGTPAKSSSQIQRAISKAKSVIKTNTTKAAEEHKRKDTKVPTRGRTRTVPTPGPVRTPPRSPAVTTTAQNRLDFSSAQKTAPVSAKKLAPGSTKKQVPAWKRAHFGERMPSEKLRKFFEQHE